MGDGAEHGVAMVAGGTGALGRWVVKVLLEAGLRVHVPWIDADEASELPGFVGEGARALTLVEADVTSPAGVERCFDGVRGRDGRLDVLCNLVGGFAPGRLEETSPATWDHMITLNATSAFLCCRAAIPPMKAAGGGAIVNVAALPAVGRGAAGMAAYAASKAAVLNLTYSLSRELRKARIRVNAVAPEILDTPANRRALPEADPSTWVLPSEAARVVAFLVGPDGATVTGSVLTLATG